VRRRAERVVIDQLADQPRETPIASAVEFEHIELLLRSAMKGKNSSRCRPCS
jgi:hypothetical protein